MKRASDFLKKKDAFKIRVWVLLFEVFLMKGHDWYIYRSEWEWAFHSFFFYSHISITQSDVRETQMKIILEDF